MTKVVYILIFIISFGFYKADAQTELLRKEIEQIIANKKADVGVAIYGIESGDTLSINNETHFPLQSIFKFHIALAVLDLVDKGDFLLMQEIQIGKNELLPNTWSPIRDKYPNGVKMSIGEIIKYTVAQSDNNGCDILLRLIGGPEVVNEYVHNLGIKDFSIQFNEEEMHKEWNVQFANWTTPKAANDLLLLFYSNNIISKASFDFLWKTMIETSTGKKRIKGKLPEGTMVAHKTGTSGTNEEGVTAAINDIGIVILPNGEHIAISVFVANSKENEEVNEMIIADITKLTWDYFINQPNLTP